MAQHRTPQEILNELLKKVHETKIKVAQKQIADDPRMKSIMGEEKEEEMMSKLRPQIFVALLILGIIAVIGMFKGLNEVTVGCVAGIIALAKDVLQSDSN